jgi:hypothetical protein
MTQYLAKVAFWLRAYDETEFEAENDADVIEKAKAVAQALMERKSYPEAVDHEERREGTIL